jgi:glycosyltransferase involved in cell wall biosynthesis
MPDKSTALLSIIIPCFNQAIYLHDCLDSILQQSFSDWEAIVVNDGSSDDTNNVAKTYCQKDSRIKLIEKQNKNGPTINNDPGGYYPESNIMLKVDYLGSM